MTIDRELVDAALAAWERSEEFLLPLDTGVAIYCNPLDAHIHLHCYFTDEEAQQVGYTLTEICCHGCGESIVATVRNGHSDDDLPTFYAEFRAAHAACGDEDARIVLLFALADADVTKFCSADRRATTEITFGGGPFVVS